MAARAYPHPDHHSGFGRHEASAFADPWEISADERIGPLPFRARRRRRRLALAVVVFASGGLLVAVGPEATMGWLSTQILALLPDGQPQSGATAPGAPVPPASPVPGVVQASAPLPALAPLRTVTTPADESPTTTVSASGDTEAASRKNTMPATPPASASGDAPWKEKPADVTTARLVAPAAAVAPMSSLQKRAEAAGLHPDLSPAVLERLSAADFRTAAATIREAVARTPDGSVLVRPQRKTAGRAQFRVEFVEGAGANCRRYVVAIARDGWAATAPPMERCGVKSPPPSKAGSGKKS